MYIHSSQGRQITDALRQSSQHTLQDKCTDTNTLGNVDGGLLSPGLPSETTVVTPNTESSWDFTTKTRSTNDDGTSLDLEWEDEEGGCL